jgi:hypothetical protein
MRGSVTAFLSGFFLFLAGRALPAAPPDTAQANEAKMQSSPLGLKILGTWKGQGGCNGDFVFRPDGTYQLTGFGPGGQNRKGTWKILGSAVPATLVLTWKTSAVGNKVSKTTKVKLIKLDDKHLALDFAKKNGGASGRYSRMK